MPKNCLRIPEKWLELEIFELLKHPSRLTKFEIYDKDNVRLCICNFVKTYEKKRQVEWMFFKVRFLQLSQQSIRQHALYWKI